MNDLNVNIDTSADLIPLQAGNGTAPLLPPFAAIPGQIRSIDGQAGPDILIATGAANKGLSVAKSSGGNTITLSISGVTTAIRESSGPTVLDIGAVADGEFLKRSGATVIGSATPAAAPTDASYLVLGAHAGLSAERVLTGTANQVILTDGGAGAALTLSTPQDIHTGATPQFARMGLGVAAPAPGAVLLLVTQSDTTLTTEINVVNAAASGNVAGAVYRAQSDTAQFQFASWASSRTTSRFGVTIGGWCELINVTGNGIIYGTFNNTPVIIGVNSLARMRIETSGNVKIAGTATRATTEGTNHLDIFNGTAPVGTLANGISLYSTTGELRVMDAAGNATLLSPHSKDGRWIHEETNFLGRYLWVDMEGLLKAVNKMLGGGYIKEEKRRVATQSKTRGGKS